MVIKSQRTALHAAYEFVFRTYYSLMYEGDPVKQGNGVVCVHDRFEQKTLVGVDWWLGKGLEGVCRLLDSRGNPIRRERQIGLWTHAHQWDLDYLRWSGTAPDPEPDPRDYESRPPRIEQRGHARRVDMYHHGLDVFPLNPNLKRVLLIDDHLPDINLFETEAKRLRDSIEWAVVSDGGEALELLDDSSVGDSWRPDLVILDLQLNVSGFSGMRVLESMRDDPELADLLAMVWSDSDSPVVMHKAYELGVTGYFVKHWDPLVRTRQVRTMLSFARWDSLQRRVWSDRRMRTR